MVDVSHAHYTYGELSKKLQSFLTANIPEEQHISEDQVLDRLRSAGLVVTDDEPPPTNEPFNPKAFGAWQKAFEDWQKAGKRQAAFSQNGHYFQVAAPETNEKRGIYLASDELVTGDWLLAAIQETSAVYESRWWFRQVYANYMSSLNDLSALEWRIATALGVYVTVALPEPCIEMPVPSWIQHHMLGRSVPHCTYRSTYVFVSEAPSLLAHFSAEIQTRVDAAAKKMTDGQL